MDRLTLELVKLDDGLWDSHYSWIFYLVGMLKNGEE